MTDEAFATQYDEALLSDIGTILIFNKIKIFS